MVKKLVQQGRSERKAEAYAGRYVEALSDARTTLEGFYNILSAPSWLGRPHPACPLE
jgi:hypothetical protein